MKNKTKLLLLFALIVVSCNMRSAISAVGPVVSQIKNSLQLSSGFAGLLTSIPLLLFGLASPIAFRFVHHLRDRVLVIGCLLAVTAGILLRSYGAVAGLIIGTVAIGIGIGILNVFMLIFIRMHFARKIGMVMGLYTMSMTLFSALASGFALPLSNALGSWNHGLAAMSILPAAAIVIWLLGTKNIPSDKQPETPLPFFLVAKKAQNWWIALFTAFASSLFFCMTSWLPSILAERGIAPAATGYLALMMQVVSLITNFLMPLMIQYFPKKRSLLGLLCALCYVVALTLLSVPGISKSLLISDVVLLGLSSGLSYSFAMTMITIQGTTREETASVSAFAQCVGFTLAAPMPTLLGSVYDHFQSFSYPVFILLALCIPMGIMGILSAKQSRQIKFNG